MKREEGLDDLVHILIQLFICTDLLRIAFLGTNPNCLNGFELAVRVMSVFFFFFLCYSPYRVICTEALLLDYHANLQYMYCS